MKTSAILSLSLIAGAHALLPQTSTIHGVGSGHSTALARSKLLKTPLRVRGGDSGMSALVVAERVCPALGFALSNALYASPIPTLNECVKKGDLGSLNPLPSALMVSGTVAWVAYGLSAKNPWITATNIPGTLVAFYQLLNMLPLMKPGPQLKQFQITIMTGVAATLLLWARLIFGGVSAAGRSYALGLFATILCIILFASPLSTIAEVLKTQNSASILAPLTISQCANWCVVAARRTRELRAPRKSDVSAHPCACPWCVQRLMDDLRRLRG